MIATARSVDHFGVVVPDRDSAVAFFTDVLGGVMTYRTDWFDSGLGHRQRLAMLRLGSRTNVELIEYKGAVSRAPSLTDVGCSHLALYVDDVRTALAQVRDLGLWCGGLGHPVGQPMEGETFAYFASPWGAYFELRSYPTGLRYERETMLRLVPPTASWEG